MPAPLPPDVGSPPVAAVVLAAGNSSRLGRPKQLLLTPDGEALLHRTVRLAQQAGCAPVVVVTGALGAELAAAVADLAPLITPNENWAAGMGSSIKTGLAAAQHYARKPLAAALILTTDQPGITAELIGELIRRHAAENPLAVATAYAGTRGIPALFDQRIFANLHQLADAQGAKPLLQQLGADVIEIPWPAAALDLDTPEQVAAWQAGAHPSSTL